MSTALGDFLSALSVEGAAVEIRYERSDSVSKGVQALYKLNGMRVSCRLVEKSLYKGLVEKSDGMIVITEKGRTSVPKLDILILPEGVQLSPVEKKKYTLNLEC